MKSKHIDRKNLPGMRQLTPYGDEQRAFSAKAYCADS